MTLIIGHYPAGSSIKNFLHIGQSVNSNRFCAYDYGKFKNLEVYKRLYPPSYNLSKMLIPSLIMYGENDYLATEKVSILFCYRLKSENPKSDNTS